jgi:hypothetical protein
MTALRPSGALNRLLDECKVPTGSLNLLIAVERRMPEVQHDRELYGRNPGGDGG